MSEICENCGQGVGTDPAGCQTCEVYLLLKSHGPCPSCGNPYFTSLEYEKDPNCFDQEIPVLHCGNCGEAFTDHSAALIRDLRRELAQAKKQLAAREDEVAESVLRIAIARIDIIDDHEQPAYRHCQEEIYRMIEERRNRGT